MLDPDAWFAACHEAACNIRAALSNRTSAGTRDEEVGSIGAGGDRTLALDDEAERYVLEAMAAMTRDAAGFTILTEERGRIDCGAPLPIIAVDPIDGSVNAKRGLVHHAVSVALADGPLTSDVALGFVYDIGADETWCAVRGQGATLNGEPILPGPERRCDDGRLELLAVETSDARGFAAFAAPLGEAAYRWRVLGSIASAMCQVAAGRVDGMINLTRCRSIDAAAAALVVSESGGVAWFPHAPRGKGVPLDLEKRSAVVAARNAETASQLGSLVSVTGG